MMNSRILTPILQNGFCLTCLHQRRSVLDDRVGFSFRQVGINEMRKALNEQKDQHTIDFITVI